MRTSNKNEPIRLNRYLALLGVGSRRTCDDLIFAGKIFVDGAKVSTPGMKVIPGMNRVSIGRTRLEKPPNRIVLLQNKSEGVVTTVSDPFERKTVIDICKQHNFKMRLFPVGRLDINTTGAILLTNDGLLCYRLTHPRFHIPKTYLVRVRGIIIDKKMRRLQKFVVAEREWEKGAGSQPRADLIKKLGNESILRIVLYEGKNRQVRRMCEASGLRVVKLKRVQFGPISIRKLPAGTVRRLTYKEITMLDKIIGLGGK